MPLIEALTPNELAQIQAEWDAEGCAWLVERVVGYDYDDNPRIEILPCGAATVLTDEYGSWRCAKGHHHHTYGSPAWQNDGQYD